MGAKKKGGLANRLARMTDEERAKYLQRKADMEEEARRRKEQLIATFMKNKLRKEDAFSRLNVAKINQNWHQAMRLNKVQAMKAEVEHLKRWIDRTVMVKNRTIKKLMEELDWQEDLYGKNFNAHSNHVDKIIDFHNRNLSKLRKEYVDDRTLLLHVTRKEREGFEDRSLDEVEYLKTIIHGQQVESDAQVKHNREEYIKEADEILSTYRTELKLMRKSREKISCAIWKEMCGIMKSYIQQTELKRSHLAELKKLDVECALVIAKDQQHIKYEEEQIEKLKQEHDLLVDSREEQIQLLKNILKATSNNFFQIRKKLSNDLKHDERQLTHLTNTSNASIAHLEALLAKSNQIQLIIQTCKKFETETDKIRTLSSFELDLIKKPSFQISSSSSSSEEEALVVSKIRPTTSVPVVKAKRCVRQFRSEEVAFAPKPPSGEKIFEISTRLVWTAVPKTKRALPKRRVQSMPRKHVFSQDDLEEALNMVDGSRTGFEELDKLEGLWSVCNKVQIDCSCLLKEKKVLEQENEKLKAMMREVLSAATLGQSIPSAKLSGIDSTRRRFILSAPLFPLVPI